MFDIGFWEMAVIALVALVVIGPRELPALIRGVSRWMARARRMAGEFRAEFTREVERAEEIKRLVEKETGIADVHRTLEEARKAVPIDGARPGTDREGGGGEDGRGAPGVPQRAGGDAVSAAPGPDCEGDREAATAARAKGGKADGPER